MVYLMVWKIWYKQLDCTPHYGVSYGLENMVHAIRDCTPHYGVSYGLENMVHAIRDCIPHHINTTANFG